MAKMPEVEWDLFSKDWEALVNEVKYLRQAIRLHRDEKGHDRCWLDDDRLYSVLPEKKEANTVLPPKDQFLTNCEKYWYIRQKSPVELYSLPIETMANKKTPPGVTQVGVGIFLVRFATEKAKQTNRVELEILLGKRKGSHGAGEWSLPGGKPDLFEDLTDAAAREVLEETGIVLQKHLLHPISWSEDKFIEEHLHFVTLYYSCVAQAAVAETKEPHKCEGWEWFNIRELPSPLFCGTKEAASKVYIHYEELLSNYTAE